jgi:O-acetyl-ADP-ribose deacetylase (regulator of RNase III)
VVTGAGRLPARFVFHTVGPVYRDGKHGEPELLASCYRKCLAMGEERNLESISFPAISTGVYGYPLREATEIAVREVRAHLGEVNCGIQQVMFVCFGRQAYETYVEICGC